MSRRLGGRFYRLFAADLVSQVGDALNFIGRAWFVVSASESPVVLSLMFIAASLPEAALSILSGRFIDRDTRRRRWVLTLAYAVRAPFSVWLGVLALAGEFDPVEVLLCVAMVAVGNGMGIPAAKALLPQLVRWDQLERAIGLLGMVYRGTQAVGPAIAGLVVGQLGLATLFFVDAAASVAAALICATIRPRAPTAGDAGGEGSHGAPRIGVLEFFSTKVVALRLVFYSVALRLIGRPLYVAFAVFVERTLYSDATVLGFLLSAFALGYALGALILLRVFANVGERARVVTSVVLCGALIAAAGLASAAVGVGILLAGGGACFAVAGITLDAWLQRELDDRVRGRAYALLGTTVALASPVAYLVMGFALESVRAPTAIVALGIVLAATSIGVARLPSRMVP